MVTVIGLFSFSVTQEAEAAAYIKFDGIDGEAQDKDHKNWSDISYLEWGIIAENSKTSRFADTELNFQVNKELDKSSPKIAESVLQGKVFPKVEIHFTASYTDSGRVTYYTIELSNVMVTSYNFSGSSKADQIPMDEFTLNFEEITVAYVELDSKGKQKGTIVFSWKLQ